MPKAVVFFVWAKFPELGRFFTVAEQHIDRNFERPGVLLKSFNGWDRMPMLDATGLAKQEVQFALQCELAKPVSLLVKL